MHMGSISTLKTTAVATGAIDERRFVTFADAQAGLDGIVKGVSEMAGIPGDAIPLTLIGVIDMVAGGVIALGAEVVSDANGRPIAKGANVNVAGRALNAAAAAGARVSILIR
ncbi:DUF2190 family protein [Ancylobacter sp. A5.8]|uniref:capsid cement protein n=1 Tax=Ancylobacter gelatini TaxID=2919920 RepID=UPI001F4E4FEB|nr:capsid cement protein [Ancylobacter gelatini]MCJ8142960.1 DUF2190 family protein [Ancylobacter gelatini]